MILLINFIWFETCLVAYVGHTGNIVIITLHWPSPCLQDLLDRVGESCVRVLSGSTRQHHSPDIVDAQLKYSKRSIRRRGKWIHIHR